LRGVLGWLLSKEFEQGIKRFTIAGRVRQCGSIQGNAINALLALGLAVIWLVSHLHL